MTSYRAPHEHWKNTGHARIQLTKEQAEIVAVKGIQTYHCSTCGMYHSKRILEEYND